MTMQSSTLVGRRLATLTLLLGGFAAFAPLSMDLYRPAFPHLADDLDTTAAAVQLTLTADVVGLPGSADHRPALDARAGAGCSWARRSAVPSRRRCALLPLGAISSARASAGLSGGAGVASAGGGCRCGSGVAAARLFSLFMTVSSVAPIAAPVAGGAVLAWTAAAADVLAAGRDQCDPRGQCLAMAAGELARAATAPGWAAADRPRLLALMRDRVFAVMR